jgi:hypothetical protein
MVDATTLQLTVQDTYPTDEDPVPVRLHYDHFVDLDVRGGDLVRLTAEAESTDFECQRNDRVPSEVGRVRISPVIREKLCVSVGDTVAVSSIGE